MPITSSVHGTLSSLSVSVPPEFRAVPIHPAGGETPLRLCVLVRAAPDAVGGRFFQLRDLLEARVYLGCVCDAGGRVHEWVELWVQTFQGLEPSQFAHQECLTNLALDQRWSVQAEATRNWLPESFLETGWETCPPLPSVIDLATFSLVHPKDPQNGRAWELCRDDALLEAAGLPPYRASLARYLYQPGEGKAARFVPVGGAPVENGATVPAAQALGLSEHVTPFNPQAGLMMATSFHPFSYEEYVDVLGGKSWPGLAHGTAQFQLGEPYQSLADWDHALDSGAYLLSGKHGRAGRLVETLHLKLQLLADACSAARARVQAHQLPFLNLSPESFRVRLAGNGRGLPFFWTAQCALVQPTEAVALRLQTTEKRLFVRTGPATGSVYLPESQLGGGRGAGTVRLRKVTPHAPNALIAEGTLVMQEAIPFSPRDLLWVRLPLPTGPVDLYGHIEKEGKAAGEAHFRTAPQQFPAAAAADLLSGKLAVFSRCQYQVIPLLSSPCDLYALAVLAIRTLLVNDKAGLQIALDETLSLARQAALDYKPETPLPERIAALFRKNGDWLESLGPHRLLAEAFSPAEASALVPPELWHEVLAAIVRLFPAGPDSHCADLGDADPLALEKVFDGPLEDLDNLLLKTRSLIVIDWSFNREVRAAIDEFRRR
jgi:hypothetical protein